MRATDYQERLTWGDDSTQSDERLAEMILYIADKMAGKGNFGSVLLNKILYFSDFEAYTRRGFSITGAEYFSLPKGPAPRRLLPVRSVLTGEMGDKPRLGIERHRFSTGTQHRPVSLDEANLSDFGAEEIALVDSIIERIGQMLSEDVSELSHDRVWRIAGTEKGSIPYQAGFISDEGLSKYDKQRTTELATRHGWIEN